MSEEGTATASPNTLLGTENGTPNTDTTKGGGGLGDSATSPHSPTPTQHPLFDGDNFISDWHTKLASTLDESDQRRMIINDSKRLGDVKNLADLARMVVEQQSQIGKIVGADKVLVPKDGDSADVVDAFAKAWGRPDSADDYKISFSDPERKIDENFEKELKELFFENKFNQGQVDSILRLEEKRETAFAAQQEQEIALERSETVKALQSEWGNAYQQKLDDIQGLLRNTGFLDEVNRLGLGQNLSFLKMADTFASRFREDSDLVGSGATIMTPDQVQEKIDAIRSDPNHPANNPGAPGHQEGLRYKESLYKQLTDLEGPQVL